MNRLWLVFAVVVALSLGAVPAMATSITFSGTGPGVAGITLSASAVFDITGNVLTIVLTNTAANANDKSKDVPGNALTGVFFDLTGNRTLTPVSATVVAGTILGTSYCYTGMCDSTTTNVGGEFRFDTGSGFPADYGVASAGYIGGSGNMVGPDLAPPAAVDGPNFSLIGTGAFSPNGGLGSVPLIQSSVTLVLSGVTGLTTSDISGVSFQYGTALDEANIPGTPSVPEPTSLLLLGSGIASLGIASLRRRNK